MELGRDPDMRRDVPKAPLLNLLPKMREKNSPAGEQDAKKQKVYIMQTHALAFSHCVSIVQDVPGSSSFQFNIARIAVSFCSLCRAARTWTTPWLAALPCFVTVPVKPRRGLPFFAFCVYSIYLLNHAAARLLPLLCAVPEFLRVFFWLRALATDRSETKQKCSVGMSGNDRADIAATQVRPPLPPHPPPSLPPPPSPAPRGPHLRVSTQSALLALFPPCPAPWS